MAYIRIERFKIGRGTEPKYKQLTGIDFDPLNSKLPIAIWTGGNFDSREGASISIGELDEFTWAFDCTNTKWFYEFLKQSPPGLPLTYELVNAEYVKHYGKDMELSLD